jgi:hypothetical protein
MTNFGYCFCPRPNFIKGICQASTNSDVLIEFGSTVVFIHTQLAVCNVADRAVCGSSL